MLKALLIVSLSERAGKTMLCVGLGRYWQNSGRKVGYFKPAFSVEGKTASEEKSVALVRQVMGLTETSELINPLLTNRHDQLQTAFTAVSQGKDIMIIEGSLDQAEALAAASGAGVLVVHDYALDLESALPEYTKLSRKLVGVVLNKVPAKKLGVVTKQAEQYLAKAGLKLLGAVPENRILAALSVGDLAEVLGGKILNNSEKATDLIENYMLGSSTFDRGAAYYQRKNNKAVLVWGERPGYRKAALASLPQVALLTSTRCVVISDAALPLPAIQQKAEEKGVPLISVPGKLAEVINRLEKAMAGTTFTQEQKILPLLSMLPAVLNKVLLTGDFNPG
jgi:BioD-like phosphotransacetylase family protein